MTEDSDRRGTVDKAKDAVGDFLEENTASQTADNTGEVPTGGGGTTPGFGEDTGIGTGSDTGIGAITGHPPDTSEYVSDPNETADGVNRQDAP